MSLRMLASPIFPTRETQTGSVHCAEFQGAKGATTSAPCEGRRMNTETHVPRRPRHPAPACVVRADTGGRHQVHEEKCSIRTRKPRSPSKPPIRRPTPLTAMRPATQTTLAPQSIATPRFGGADQPSRSMSGAVWSCRLGEGVHAGDGLDGVAEAVAVLPAVAEDLVVLHAGRRCARRGCRGSRQGLMSISAVWDIRSAVCAHARTRSAAVRRNIPTQRPYPSDLSDAERELIAPVLSARRFELRGRALDIGQPRKTCAPSWT